MNDNQKKQFCYCCEEHVRRGQTERLKMETKVTTLYDTVCPVFKVAPFRKMASLCILSYTLTTHTFIYSYIYIMTTLKKSLSLSLY